MKNRHVNWIVYGVIIAFFLFLNPKGVSAQTIPFDLSFPPVLLLQQETSEFTKIGDIGHVTSWEMPLNDAILQFLGEKFTTNNTSKQTQNITQIIQPAYNISDDVSITTSSESNYKTNIVITSSTTNNQTITFPDASGEVSLLGQTISGGEIVDDTIDLLTKTTGNYLANLMGGSGLSILGTGIQAASPSVSLSNLTEDWVQSGAFDIVLNNADSALKMLDSDGTNYAVFDVGNLSSDITYTLSGTTGTLLTSANYNNFLSGLGTGDMLAANNLSDVGSALTARGNLGLGSVATMSAANILQTTNNLADVLNVSTTRTNLGLGSAAVENVSAFLQTANNLSDLGNASTARGNLGLGSIATQSTASFLQVVNNLSDLPNALTARSNLGLGTIATQSAGNIFLSGGSLNGVNIPATLNTISGLTTSNFSSVNISQWTNNSGFITSSTTDTLTNKTLTSPVLNGTVTTSGLTFPAFSSGAINGLTFSSESTGFTFSGGTTSKTLTILNSLTFAGTDGTTLTLPGSSDTIVGLTTAQTLTNKTLSTVTNTISGLTTSNFSSANLSQWTNNSGFITSSTSDTLTNKTLTAPVINGIVTTSGLTLPAFTAGGNITGSGSPTISSFGSINGLTLSSATDGLTITGGTTPRTVTVAGADITIGNVIQPTSDGGLTIRSTGANTLTLDSGGNAGINIGTSNANEITLGASATVSANKTFTVTDSDSLRVGGNIIPQYVTIAVPMTASLVDQNVFIADASYQLNAVRCVYSVAASLNGGVQVTVDTGTGSPGSGTDQLSSSINLSTTVNTVYTGTLIGSPTVIVAGNKVSLDMSGTLLGLLGTCTLTMKRV